MSLALVTLVADLDFDGRRRLLCVFLVVVARRGLRCALLLRMREIVTIDDQIDHRAIRAVLAAELGASRHQLTGGRPRLVLLGGLDVEEMDGLVEHLLG